MVKEVVVATKNPGKLNEFVRMLHTFDIRIHSLDDYPNIPDIVEDGSTFEENAKKKAEFIRDLLHIPALADDSGLMVDALDGAPGIYSARFAGEEKNDEKNMQKLLEQLQGMEGENRKAHFVSVIALAVPQEPTIVVRGTLSGVIAMEPRGNHGFGYDPIFYLPEYQKTLAEISHELKNKISHRAAALEKLVQVIRQQKFV